MNELETTFQRIMTDYGHDVLVVHNDRDEVCSCYDPVTGSVDRDCPYCFGTGNVAQIKKYRTRYIDAHVPESNVFLTHAQSFGSLSVGARTYFFYKDSGIRAGDLIMEVDWDGIRPIYGQGAIYEVSHLTPLRYTNGEIIYFKVYTKEQPLQKDVRGFQIVKRAGEVQYQLAEGKPHNIQDPNAKQDPSRRLEQPSHPDRMFDNRIGGG